MSRTAHIKHCLATFKGCRRLAGDVAECGVGFGHLTFMLDSFVRAENKKLFAFDTYTGLPYDDTIKGDHMCKAGEMNCGVDFFDVFDELEDTSIIPVSGLVEETLLGHSGRKFCFVWIDMDVYHPTSFAYRFFESRVVPGGVIGFHDYGFYRCPGVAEVVDHEVDRGEYEAVLNEDNCYFVRRVQHV